MSENFLSTALATLPPEKMQGIGDGILNTAGIVRAVLSGLISQGVTAGSWADVFKITMMVLDLINAVGPEVEAIIAAIKKALGQ